MRERCDECDRLREQLREARVEARHWRGRFIATAPAADVCAAMDAEHGEPGSDSRPYVDPDGMR
jgi:hypothetical protein